MSEEKIEPKHHIDDFACSCADGLTECAEEYAHAKELVEKLCGKTLSDLDFINFLGIEFGWNYQGDVSWWTDQWTGVYFKNWSSITDINGVTYQAGELTATIQCDTLVDGLVNLFMHLYNEVPIHEVENDS